MAPEETCMFLESCRLHTFESYYEELIFRIESDCNLFVQFGQKEV
jgi:hypothetical protein